MTRLPVLSGRKLVSLLRRFGYEVDRQTGSHIVLRNIAPPHRRLTIPNHRTIAKGTLRLERALDPQAARNLRFLLNVDAHAGRAGFHVDGPPLGGDVHLNRVGSGAAGDELGE